MRWFKRAVSLREAPRWPMVSFGFSVEAVPAASLFFLLLLLAVLGLPSLRFALPPFSLFLPNCGKWQGIFGMPEKLSGGNTAQDMMPLMASDEGPKQRNWGLLVTGIIGGTLVALYSVATPFIAPALRKHCLPYVPATSKQVENVLRMLKGRNGPLVDIGSGDGRIVIAAAKVGFKAVGYELNPWLVWYSRYCAWREGVHQDAKFYISDLWKVSFAQYTNVVIFGVPQMMLQLEKKLGEELALDARVIACRFPFPRWRPNHSFGEGIDAVWAYDSESFRMKEENDLIKTKCILSN